MIGAAMAPRRSTVCVLVAVVFIALVAIVRLSRDGAEGPTAARGSMGAGHAAEVQPPSEPTPARPAKVPLARSLPTAPPQVGAASSATREGTHGGGGSPTAAELERIRERIEENEARFDAAYDAALHSIGLSAPEIEQARRVFEEAADRIAELEERARAGELVEQAEIEEQVDAVLAERERRLTEILGEERARRFVRVVGDVLYETRPVEEPPPP